MSSLVSLRTILLFLSLSCRWLIVPAVVESFNTEQLADTPYVERDEQINTLYSTWEGYGLDCYHHINQDMSLRLYFRGSVIAEAKVSSCSRGVLSKAIQILPFTSGKHSVNVCIENQDCSLHYFSDSQLNTGGSFRLTKPSSRLPNDGGSCVNEWCRFGELDEELKRKIFFHRKRTTG